MFSTSMGRVVRTAPSLSTTSSPSCAISSRPASALAAANHLLARRNQQRRNSSTSCPPDNSRGAGPSQTQSSKQTEKKAAPRGRSRKMNVPHVPPTNYLKENDVALSSFFSVHRPMSVTTLIPTTASESSFNAIFESRKPSNASKYGQTIYTLGNAVKSLEGASQESEETELRAEILQNSAESDGVVHHLDGQRQYSLNEALAQMRPFNPPPPPAPQGRTQDASKVEVAEADAASPTTRHKPEKKVWKATITVTESTDESGHKTFSATTSPAIRVPTNNGASIEEPEVDEAVHIRQPFLERMEIREQKWLQLLRERGEISGRPTMHAISVKRQRKLKMKKHKYKKLMKKTRNLRRKLGQA
ncbi:mitochondrial 37S ribosomal protein mS38 [Phyllosticta citriasiana]|uniref:Small ribosomal subunit protein mS38 n=1 Tax=Phyllosticta citriasiana TaxID=595635 RepID=A0ABR1KSQ8_9PEZI